MWANRRQLLRRLLKEAEPRPAAQRGAVPRGGSGVTPEQAAVIDILASSGGGLSVRQIGEHLSWPYANVTRTLDRLEKKGIIIRARSRADRRQAEVRLTVEGARVARRLAEIKARFLDLLWDRYTDDEKRQLLDLLSR